jgi:long-chain acyl-CoA synthetase
LEHGLLAPVWAGSGVHLCPGLDLNVVVPQLAEGGITLFPSVPSAYDMMCQVGEARRLTGLRKAYAAGAPLPRAVYDAFEAKFGMRIGQLYGATEIGSVTFSDPDAAGFDPASVGRRYENVRVRIAGVEERTELPVGEEGEVLVSATSMFRGYLNETNSGNVDGYFPTGDLGRLDDVGNLTITGRLKLLIEVGGLKVNVLEVEELLAQHPSVGEAAVVAVRVTETVSRLKAVVTPRDLERPPEPEEIRSFLRGRLTAYKVPRVVEVRASLPRSPSGKVLRRLLEAP